MNDMITRLRENENSKLKVFSDPLLYESKNWNITPMEGEVFPGGFKHFVINFEPSEAIKYNDIAWMNITGIENRMKLEFQGYGIGPKAIFSFDSLDVGKAYADAVYEYTVSLQNIGDIAGVFHLETPKELLQKYQVNIYFACKNKNT